MVSSTGRNSGVETTEGCLSRGPCSDKGRLGAGRLWKGDTKDLVWLFHSQLCSVTDIVLGNYRCSA